MPCITKRIRQVCFFNGTRITHDKETILCSQEAILLLLISAFSNNNSSDIEEQREDSNRATKSGKGNNKNGTKTTAAKAKSKRKSKSLPWTLMARYVKGVNDAWLRHHCQLLIKLVEKNGCKARFEIWEIISILEILDAELDLWGHWAKILKKLEAKEKQKLATELLLGGYEERMPFQNDRRVRGKGGKTNEKRKKYATRRNTHYLSKDIQRLLICLFGLRKHQFVKKMNKRIIYNSFVKLERFYQELRKLEYNKHNNNNTNNNNNAYRKRIAWLKSNINTQKGIISKESFAFSFDTEMIDTSMSDNLDERERFEIDKNGMNGYNRNTTVKTGETNMRETSVIDLVGSNELSIGLIDNNEFSNDSNNNNRNNSKHSLNKSVATNEMNNSLIETGSNRSSSNSQPSVLSLNNGASMIPAISESPQFGIMYQSQNYSNSNVIPNQNRSETKCHQNTNELSYSYALPFLNQYDTLNCLNFTTNSRIHLRNEINRMNANQRNEMNKMNAMKTTNIICNK